MIALSILKSLALGIWLGALIMLGYAVAGPIFRGSPSKTVAGQINGVILGRMNNMEWVCGVVALISAAMLLWLNWNEAGRTVRISEMITIAIALVVLWIYSIRISSRMETLRQTIGDFDHPNTTTEYIQAKSEFDDLHHLYTKLVGANMMLILGSFVMSCITIRKP